MSGFRDKDLLELKWYDGKAPTIYLVRSKCLPLLAYGDYFPDNPGWGRGLRSMVSRAILGATPGWCGAFGPGVDGAPSVADDPTEGNYDMTQMFLLPIAYRHYDDLTPARASTSSPSCWHAARSTGPNEGRFVHERPQSERLERAGFVSPGARHIDIGETENHILMIVTTRYLTNQLLYQRDAADQARQPRNGGDRLPSCVDRAAPRLLRNICGVTSPSTTPSPTRTKRGGRY